MVGTDGNTFHEKYEFLDDKINRSETEIHFGIDRNWLKVKSCEHRFHSACLTIRSFAWRTQFDLLNQTNIIYSFVSSFSVRFPLKKSVHKTAVPVVPHLTVHHR